MLQLIKSPTVTTFNELEQLLGSSLRHQVAPFARDAMLKRFQDSEDLYNIALLKLDEAIKNFVYDKSLEDDHNERRFLAMLKTYVRNAMIDEQYSANVDKRKPKVPLRSLTTFQVNCDGDGGDSIYDPPSREAPICDAIAVAEIIDRIGCELPYDEFCILTLLCDGFSAERIAGKLGLQTSRVRYVIYEKIQPRASRYVKHP